MEKLFCSLGDIIRIIAAIATTPWPGEKSITVEVGATYKVIDLVGEGWDLKRISGKGPDELRILNSEMGKYVTVIGKDN